MTSDIDFQLESGAPAVASGTVGWLELPDRPREALTIPSAAVLQSAEGPYVLVLQPDRASAFTRRPIQLGRTSSGESVVQAGLLPGERVVVRSAFFLDAEGRLGPGAEPPAGEPMISRVVAWSARRHWLIAALTLCLAVAGELARRALPRDVLPDLSDAQIALVVDWSGHPAAEVAARVTRPLTRALEGLAGSTAVRGSSMSDLAYIDVVFSSGADLPFARRAILERVSEVRSQLPSAAGIRWVRSPPQPGESSSTSWSIRRTPRTRSS